MIVFIFKKTIIIIDILKFFSINFSLTFSILLIGKPVLEKFLKFLALKKDYGSSKP